MLYTVKYRYVDDKGEEKVFFDGFDRSRRTVVGVYSSDKDERLCAYMSKGTASDIKRLIDGMLEDMLRRGKARKVWKAKVLPASGHAICGGKTKKAADNAALRYYFSLCA